MQRLEYIIKAFKLHINKEYSEEDIYSQFSRYAYKMGNNCISCPYRYIDNCNKVIYYDIAYYLIKINKENDTIYVNDELQYCYHNIIDMKDIGLNEQIQLPLIESEIIKKLENYKNERERNWRSHISVRKMY